jgi:hypothetical protein
MPAPILPLADVVPLLPPRGALIGLDLGTKTIGIAASDPDRRLAAGVETIARKNFTVGNDDQDVGFRITNRLKSGALFDGRRLDECQRKVSRLGADGRGFYRPAPPNRARLTRHNQSNIMRGAIQCVERRNRPRVISEKDHPQSEG